MSLNVAVSALNTNQAALQVIGHNIANANTPGYSRQNISLEQIPGQKFGNGFFGKGVEVAAVERAFSQFLTREANLTSASASAANIRYQRLQTLEQLFPMGEAGMGRQLNGFLNSWADAVASPTNQTARGVVLTRADEFANRLNQTASQLEELRSTTRVQIEAGIAEANRLTASIASINQRVVDSFASGRPPNDLLDQRDRLVAELNKIVQVTTLEADDRSMTVFVGGSVPVVLANRSTNLVGSDSVSTQGRYTIGFGSADAVINEELIGGGLLKGVMTFYNDDVADVRNQVGRLALATIELTNRQHRAGVDLNGQPGGDFFNPVSFVNAVVELNTSAADLQVSVSTASDAPTRFQASDYAVRYVAPDQVQIQRVSDGLYATAATPNPPNPLQMSFTSATPVSVAFPDDATDPGVEFDGLRLNLSTAGLVDGDQFVLRPMSGISAQIKVALTSPSQLALASPVLVEAGVVNSDNLQVESLFRPAGATPPAGWTRSEVVFSGGQYQVRTFGADPLIPTATTALANFTSGNPIEIDGFRLVLRGQPADGDVFTVRPPAAGESLRQNAGNGQALLALRDLDALDGYTLSDGYIPVFSEVSSSIQVAKADAEFASRVAEQAESRRSNDSGVNLDEEAARLIQYQQAYQAAAKYLSSLQSNFGTLLSTFR